MTPIEIMALVVSIIVILKILTIKKSQKLWFKSVTKRYWGSSLLMIISLTISIVSLVFLLQELTIIQIWATMIFSMSLITLGLAHLSKYMLQIEKEWFKKENMLKKGWLATIVWVALSIWVLIALFTLS